MNPLLKVSHFTCDPNSPVEFVVRPNFSADAMWNNGTCVDVSADLFNLIPSPFSLNSCVKIILSAKQISSSTVKEVETHAPEIINKIWK